MTPSDNDRKKGESLKGQITRLRSGHRSSILEALKDIRMDSQPSILPEVFDLLVSQEDEEIRLEAATLLNDLKMAEAAPILAEAVGNAEYASIQKILVAACWQNGLSYGPYAEVFVKAALEGSYETCIEAYTVLEEAVGELDEHAREKLAASLRQGLVDAPEEKQLLLRELVRSIETYNSPENWRLDL
jgi:HEAT repeat protein